MILIIGNYLVVIHECTTFATELKKETIMTAMQLNAEVLRNMSIIAEDENLLKRAAKYLRKLVAEKTVDPTEMTREEFFASLARGEEAYRQGKTHRINSKAELTQFLNSL